MNMDYLKAFEMARQSKHKGWSEKSRGSQAAPALPRGAAQKQRLRHGAQRTQEEEAEGSEQPTTEWWQILGEQ
jgi:hypothetical protein